MAVTILGPKKYKPNPATVYMGSMPGPIYRRIVRVPEFDWIFESGENMARFLKKNPQFKDEHYHKLNIHDIPLFVINKDDCIFNLRTGKFEPGRRIK